MNIENVPTWLLIAIAAAFSILGAYLWVVLFHAPVWYVVSALMLVWVLGVVMIWTNMRKH